MLFSLYYSNVGSSVVKIVLKYKGNHISILFKKNNG